MKNKTIFTVECEIPGMSDKMLSFTTKTSLMDTDIVVFNTSVPSNDINGFFDLSSTTHNGKPCYSDNASFIYKEYVAHWKNELTNFLNAGKTVFVLLSERKEFYLATGAQNQSGTGKNAKTTRMVNLHSNYEFLPLDIGKLTSSHGKHIEFSGNAIFSNFYKTFKNYLTYFLYIENAEGTVIFNAKDKTKAFGSFNKVGNGHLIMLPYIKYNQEDFTETQNNKLCWNAKGMKFGDELKSSILNIDHQITKLSELTPPPSWANSMKYSSACEKVIFKQIDKNKKEYIRLEAEKIALQEKLLSEQVFKHLLYEQSTTLENAVIQALKTLGYTAENYNDGVLELDQVITSPEGHRYIGECEGKDSKAISIEKYRQLLESINADFDREEVKEKAFGILFGNAERLIDPENRKLDFTEKCRIGAARDKIALVKTLDLFNIVYYLRENLDTEFQLACRNAIHNGLGTIVIFPAISKHSEKAIGDGTKSG